MGLVAFVGSLLVVVVGCGAPPPGAAAPSTTPPPATSVPDAARLWPSTVRDDPRAAIELAPAPSYAWDSDDHGSPHYRDVMEHTPAVERWAQTPDDVPTIAHESHHGLQHAVGQTRTNQHFFYFRDGLGAFVVEPRAGLRPLEIGASGETIYTEDAYTATPQIIAALPASARALAHGRVDVYLVPAERQSYGVMTILDEWNAYLAGARVGLELERSGYYASWITPTSSTRTDLMSGPVDFLYFSSAAMLALAAREPDYWAAHSRQLGAVFAAFAEDTMVIVAESRGRPVFAGFHGDALLDDFVRSPDNQEIRAHLTAWLGAAYTRRVFGF